MKKTFFALLIVTCLCSCATTYNTNIPKQNERVNPYDQKPLPNNGLAGVIRDIINR